MQAQTKSVNKKKSLFALIEKEGHRLKRSNGRQFFKAMDNDQKAINSHSPLWSILENKLSPLYFRLLDEDFEASKRYNYLSSKTVTPPLTLKNIVNGVQCFSQLPQDSLIFIYKNKYILSQAAFEAIDTKEIFKGLGKVWFLSNEEPGMEIEIVDLETLRRQCWYEKSNYEQNDKVNLPTRSKASISRLFSQLIVIPQCSLTIDEMWERRNAKCQTIFNYKDAVIQPFFFNYETDCYVQISELFEERSQYEIFKEAYLTSK